MIGRVDWLAVAARWAPAAAYLGLCGWAAWMGSDVR